jgi:hypothetical protein
MPFLSPFMQQLEDTIREVLEGVPPDVDLVMVLDAVIRARYSLNAFDGNSIVDSIDFHFVD